MRERTKECEKEGIIGLAEGKQGRQKARNEEQENLRTTENQNQKKPERWNERIRDKIKKQHPQKERKAIQNTETIIRRRMKAGMKRIKNRLREKGTSE